MTTSGQVDTQLLLAVLKVAREECGHADWDTLEPALKSAWEQLRAEDTPAWEVVAEEVQAVCWKKGYLA